MRQRGGLFPLLEFAPVNLVGKLRQNRISDTLMLCGKEERGKLNCSLETSASGTLLGNFPRKKFDRVLDASLARSLLGKLQHVG